MDFVKTYKGFDIVEWHYGNYREFGWSTTEHRYELFDTIDEVCEAIDNYLESPEDYPFEFWW